MSSNRPTKHRFQFKQFIVYQDQCAMKVGTDGVLLGAWAEVSSDQSVLDVGTGTGLIALMIAQRSQGVIDAIDIDESACRQATHNFALSDWHSRLSAHCLSLADYSIVGKQYQHIVSNPPYFIDSLQSPDPKRTAARHADSMPFDSFFAHCKRLLSPDGRLSVIIPTSISETVIEFAQAVGLHPRRVTLVCPTPLHPPKRSLIEFRQTIAPVVTDRLIIETNRHCYSEAYANLTQTYYL